MKMESIIQQFVKRFQKNDSVKDQWLEESSCTQGKIYLILASICWTT